MNEGIKRAIIEHLVQEEKENPTNPKYLYWSGKMSVYIHLIHNANIENIAEIIGAALFCARKYDELIFGDRL